MDKIDIRMTRDQLAALTDALATVVKDHPGDGLAADWEELGVYLMHRYTRRWGLPPRVAAGLSPAQPPRTD